MAFPLRVKAPISTMRISLIAHGFPPLERTGVETYSAALAAALVRAGHQVEVFVPRRAPELPEHSMRRETRDGYGLTWLTINNGPEGPEQMLDPVGVAGRFGDFLDRERPELVHFQHVVKLGVGLIEEARKRGIPTVYTAHDYYALCHRYTLLRPDLERCEIVGDSAACARCDLGLSLLNQVEGLGDYQQGVAPENLPAPDAAKLQQLLDGDWEAAGFSPQDWEAASKLRSKLDERRAQAYAGLDRILAPTKFLLEKLVEIGIERKRLTHLPYGIETGQLGSVPPVRPDPSAPVRFGFFGGFSKQKGVHVLVEAFEQMKQPAELTLWGYGTDPLYQEQLRASASRAGVRWGGAYEQKELPDLLAQVDVVVVPSLWVENYPIAIREALAAGRPVLASRLGALPESVREGIDGLLFEVGSAADLAQKLDRFCVEDGLIQSLASGIEEVHSLDAQALELTEIYGSMLAPAAQAPSRLPANLQDFESRLRQLSSLPSRELFKRVSGGLRELAAKLAPDVRLDELLREAFDEGSRAQELLRDRRRQARWMSEALHSKSEAEQSLKERTAWMDAVLEDKERARQALQSELAQEREARAAIEREREWLKEQLADRDAGLESLRAELGGQGKALDSLREERDWLDSLRLEHGKELDRMRAERERLETEQKRLEAERKSLEAELGTMEQMLHMGQQHVGVLQGELQGLLQGLDRALDDPTEDQAAGADDATSAEPGSLEMLPDLTKRTRVGLGILEALESELIHRREQMDALQRAYSSTVVRILLKRTGMARLLNEWELFYDPEEPQS